MIGLAVYTHQSGVMKVPGLEFGFSYMLTWGGVCLSLVGAGLACLDQMKKSAEYTRAPNYNHVVY